MRQESPVAACFLHVPKGVEQLSFGVETLRCIVAHVREIRQQKVPFRIRDVAGISLPWSVHDSKSKQFRDISQYQALDDNIEPRVVLLIGDAEREIDSAEKRKSFEQFRSSIASPEVVTFDELFRKVEVLSKIFSLARVPLDEGTMF